MKNLKYTINRIDTTRKMTTAYRNSLFFISFRLITSSTRFENVSSPFTRFTCATVARARAYVVVRALQLLPLRVQIQFDVAGDVVHFEADAPRVVQPVVLRLDELSRREERLPVAVVVLPLVDAGAHQRLAVFLHEVLVLALRKSALRLFVVVLVPTNLQKGTR